ncbi:acyl-CoA synthetase [Mycolicibacterium sp. P9-64]|uniref:AMP-binding protein n=1 Tax=Mycolicibacterium sp. P9-64 TaxID=2024612 RepID=UPI0011ECE25F|nr:AMP-binding protein [Mycolicibacterium sp. P9-64]KAA0087109.1 acyl-CoA synthetase [Mycolicibacterium sp. P9-64]
MPEPTLLTNLRERAGLQPNDPAFTFTDYEQDWAGVSETLTWSQAYRRTLNVAAAVQPHGAPGDRALILAPQGLDYIAAFLGAMQAGLIAVPLSVPQVGSHDERVSAVLADTSPTVILTTSAVADSITEYIDRPGVETVPTVIAVDSLDLDARGATSAAAKGAPEIAYLQYTSGSTRLPAGVMLSHRNLQANFQQLMAHYFVDYDGVAPPDTTIVSWLPFYHDMGLILGICGPILGGYRSELTSPMAFLQRPARWVQAMAKHSHVFSAGPNFAFELAVRKTSDEDMAGLDLGNVLSLVSGAERVHPATLDRFVDRFSKFNFGTQMMRPSYGLAEATVYVASRSSGRAPEIVDFESDELADGTAKRCATGTGTPLISYGVPQSPIVRIVDPEAHTECAAGSVGEIWVHGDNVALGYWQKPDETQTTFNGVIDGPSQGTPEGPWLRTGDLGFLSEDELFIVGRIKDLLIVYGRNHYPEDIEATVQEITGGRVAAISVRVDHTEKLVTIIEVKKRGDDEESLHKLSVVKNDVTSAISKSHGLNVADLVLVGPGSIPTTTSGKIQRSACVDQYRHQRFARLDA